MPAIATDEQDPFGFGPGHDKPCYYCGKPTQGHAGNANLWPVGLPHRSEPGVMKYHHIGCVTDHLIENVLVDGEAFQDWITDAKKWRQHVAQKQKWLKRWSNIWFTAAMIGGATVIIASFMYPSVPVRLPMAVTGFAFVCLGLYFSNRQTKLLDRLVALAQRGLVGPPPSGRFRSSYGDDTCS